MSPRLRPVDTGPVTAVIVSHDGERWIPRLLSALEAGTIAPDRVVCVDTASVDSSPALLVAAFGADAVVHAPRSTGFGAAVALGLAAPDSSRRGRHAAVTGTSAATADGWVWLLHDDCAPAPDALERLLETATNDSTIGVVGARMRSWPRGRRLLEVGVTITGTGRRDTGLEPGEYDQGQHDEVRTVLAVSSAGMLVRRAVWDELGGFEPALPLFRDDVDFGWRASRAGWRVVVAPAAVVFHSEASTRGARDIACTSGSPHRADRRAALFTLLANAPPRSLPWQYLRLVGGSVLRALGYLVGKLPSAALDEAAALTATVLRPGGILAARAARRRFAAVEARQLRPLFPPWPAPYLDGLDAVLSRFGGSLRRADSGPTTRRRLRSAPLLVTGLLVVAALVAARGLLGAGLLHGGSLLPAPGGASDWWRLYGQTRHGGVHGSDLVTAPYVVALGTAGAVLLGKAWLVVDVLMVLAVPLAAAGAYAASVRLVGSVPVRLWMAATYGLVPVVTGAVTTGHVGTVAALIASPWLLRAGVALLDPARAPTWQAASLCGLLLALIAAFAPVAEPMAVALLLVGAPLLLARGEAGRIKYAVVVVALPLVVLVPWSLRVLADPGLLLTEAGLVSASTRSVADVAWQLPLGRLGAAGAAPWVLTAGVLLAAVCSVLGRGPNRTGIAAAWLVIAVASVTAAVLSAFTVTVPLAGSPAHVWLGAPVGVAQGAAVVAVGLAGDGVVAGWRSGRLGWRRLLAAVVAAAALAAPVAGVVWWVAVAPYGELSRNRASPLPAYMSDDLAANTSRRALVLRRAGSGVTYQLVSGDGLRLGDDSVLPQHEPDGLARLVAKLLAEPRPAAARRLADAGVSYVVLPSPAQQHDVAALDRLPGLTRASTDLATAYGWQVSARSQGAAVVASDGTQPAVLARHRAWWLAAEALACLVALVLAAPSYTRGDPGDEEDR
jgi:GT2 family glycosyltransferase